MSRAPRTRRRCSARTSWSVTVPFTGMIEIYTSDRARAAAGPGRARRHQPAHDGGGRHRVGGDPSVARLGRRARRLARARRRLGGRRLPHDRGAHARRARPRGRLRRAAVRRRRGCEGSRRRADRVGARHAMGRRRPARERAAHRTAHPARHHDQPALQAEGRRVPHHRPRLVGRARRRDLPRAARRRSTTPPCGWSSAVPTTACRCSCCTAGPGLDHHEFGDYLDPLTERGIRLLLVDQRSCGRSERPSPQTWTLERYAQDVVMLARALRPRAVGGARALLRRVRGPAAGGRLPGHGGGHHRRRAACRRCGSSTRSRRTCRRSSRPSCASR